jgi:SCO1/SenC
VSCFGGKWLLIYFGYPFCLDLCPTALSDISVALVRGCSLHGQARGRPDKDGHKRRRMTRAVIPGQHADEAVFHITKYGPFDSTPQDAVSFMAALKDRLTMT